MATVYTISLHTGMKLHLTLDDAPIHMRVEFNDGKNVNFHYDPSSAPSKIAKDDDLKQRSNKVADKRYTSRISAAAEWIEYESTDAQGTEH